MSKHHCIASRVPSVHVTFAVCYKALFFLFLFLFFFNKLSVLLSWAESTRQPLLLVVRAGNTAKVRPEHGPGAAGAGWHRHSTQLWLLLLYVPPPCLTCSQKCKAIECPQLYISFCLSCIIPSVWSAWKV